MQIIWLLLVWRTIEDFVIGYIIATLMYVLFKKFNKDQVRKPTRRQKIIFALLYAALGLMYTVIKMLAML